MKYLTAGALVGAILIPLYAHCQTSAPADSDKLDACDQTISYRLVPPADNVPANVRAFSGIWVGGFGNPLWCHVLVVQSVSPDGNASVILGYSRNDRWRVGNPANHTMTAKISANTLTITRNRYRHKDEYVVTGPSSMTAQFYVDIYVIPGTFQRR